MGIYRKPRPWLRAFNDIAGEEYSLGGEKRLGGFSQG